jgi:hypothetical protein
VADVPDLDALGEAVTPPDTTASDRARARLLGADGDQDDQDAGQDGDQDAGVYVDPYATPSAPEGTAGLGRFGDLALWWSAVRGEDAAGPARDALHVGATTPHQPARWAGPVRRVALDPPDEIGAAIAWGVALADDAADRGADLLLLTAADPVAWRVVTAELMGLDAVEAEPWPLERGMTDAEWMDEVVVVRDGLRRTRGLRGQPNALLEALGRPRTAAAAALLVQATARRTPVLLDGPGACAAALLARRTARVASAWWQVAGRPSDPLHDRILGSMDLQPLTDLGVRTEDGTSALVALAVLDAAAALLGDAG